MLKKSSKGGKVSGKNDTQDNYGGVKMIFMMMIVMIFMILTIMAMTVLMTLLIVSWKETEDNYEEINLKRGDGLKREDISEVSW